MRASLDQGGVGSCSEEKRRGGRAAQGVVRCCGVLPEDIYLPIANTRTDHTEEERFLHASAGGRGLQLLAEASESGSNDCTWRGRALKCLWGPASERIGGAWQRGIWRRRGCGMRRGSGWLRRRSGRPET
eukprot:6272318-Prymnesium_polylepis.1